MADKSLEKFLRIQFGSGDGIRKVVLTHAAPGSSKSAIIESFEPSEGSTIEDMSSLADEIAARAQSDADGLGGVQRYVLLAYSDSGKAKGRHTFRLRGDDDDGTGLSGEESPDMRGLTMQLMRHNENNMRTMNSSLGMVMRAMGETLQNLQEQNQMLMGRQLEYIKMREEAESKAHERDVELLRATNEEKRRDAIYEKLMLLAPAVVNRFAGKKVIPDNDPGVLMLASFAESLTQEQIAAIAAKLSPEQQIVLGQIIQGSRKQLASKTE